MNFVPDSLQHDVFEMLGVETSDGLPVWLAERLRVRYPEAAVRLLRVFPGGAARMKGARQEEFSLSDSDDDDKGVQPLRDDPFLSTVLHDRACREERLERGSRYVVTLAAGGEVRYAIEIRSTTPGMFGPRIAEIAALSQAYFERLAHLETDPLTRLRTRRVFQAHIEASLRTWSRSDRRYFLSVLDIDRFKSINDEFGHLYGDEILVHFANVMRKSFRASDLLYRFGGEEFVLIHGAARGQAGEIALERFRKAVESYEFPGVGRVTVSIGYTQITEVSTPAAVLVDRADQAVYYAKDHGRNQVHCWETLVAQGAIKPKVADSKDVTLF